jgi:ATP-dependent Lhr-like helicase
MSPLLLLDPPITPPLRLAARAWSPEEALVELVRGRLQGLGPVTASALAASLGVGTPRLEAALAALEGEGFAMRGRFTPGLGAAEEEEWCERRLLARIHRTTLDRLRREIDPVSAADFLRFLFAWQRVAAGEHAEGAESLAALLAQLEGFEMAAAAWEGEVLPARLADYDPAWLDALCLSGRVTWGRLGAVRGDGRSESRGGRRSGPVRATPIALLDRAKLAVWRRAGPGDAPTAVVEERVVGTVWGVSTAGGDLSGNAQAVWGVLARRGASFFGEIAAGAGLLHTQVEEALAELVAWGLATADSYAGLRALLVPAGERPKPTSFGGGARRRGGALAGMEHAGRWSLVPAAEPGDDAEAASDAIDTAARVLLRRYGVVFRKLLERETLAPAWGELLRVYRRLEARGEIRGGRFVGGFSGEQFALPEAVGKLRALRRTPGQGELVGLSASDPLNLVGIITPGAKVAALAGNRVLYRDGVPVAVWESRQARLLVDAPPAEAWTLETALRKRTVPAPLKALLGRGA